MSEDNGRSGLISWQQLVTVVLPIIVAIVTGGVIVANIMLANIREQFHEQQAYVRDMTHTLYRLQEQISVIRTSQRRFYTRRGMPPAGEEHGQNGENGKYEHIP